MFENECALNAFLMRYLDLLLADVPERDLDEIPYAGCNPPRWTLGHLAVYTDYCLRATGARFRCPKEWHRCFVRGSAGDSRPAEIPTGTRLLGAIHEGFAEARSRCRAMDPAAAAAAHRVSFLQGTGIDTVGHLVAHLLTTHVAAHLGQLSAWRRVRGLPAVEPAAS